jgi:large subunit ribosomal protein L21
MYAVIISGGKQYRVTAGDTITVNKLEGAAGDAVKIEQILSLSGDKTVIGSPTVAGALVEAQIIAQTRNDTVIVFKKKRRQHYKRKNGHRQPMTKLFITSVGLNGEVAAKAEPRKVSEKKAAAPAAKKAPAKKEAAPKKAAAAKPAAAKKPAAKKPAAKKEA